MLHTECEDEWQKEVSSVEEFSLELGGEMKPLSCVEVVAMDSPGYGLYGTWTLSVSPRCPGGPLGQLVAQVEGVLCG